MVAVKYILCFVALYTCCLYAAGAAELECEPNEVEDDCPAFCPSYSCPRNEQESRAPPCKTPDPCPQPSCKSQCRFNYRRAENGTCIPARDCPPFPCKKVNEEFQACPPLCPTDDCSQATPDGRCPVFGTIGIVVTCSPACRCIKGYWRKNGICVPYAECGRDDMCGVDLDCQSERWIDNNMMLRIDENQCLDRYKLVRFVPKPQNSIVLETKNLHTLVPTAP